MSRIALVTGGGTGIGASIAVALAEDGWTVVVCGRRLVPLEAVASAHPTSAIHPLVADVTDELGVSRLFEEIVHRFGRLDLLVNNAGRGGSAVPIDEVSSAEWRAVVDLNVTGTFLCTREAFRTMRRSGTSRWEDPQQRIDLGPRAAADVYRLHDHEARGDGVDEGDSARRPSLQHLLRPVRRRQRVDRDDSQDECRGTAGRRNGTSRTDLSSRAGRCRGRVHREPAARYECARADDRGDGDALHRAGLRLVRRPTPEPVLALAQLAWSTVGPSPSQVSRTPSATSSNPRVLLVQIRSTRDFVSAT